MKPELLVRVSLIPCAMILLCATLSPRPIYAQAGLRESLERLDRNQNGMIEPNEVTTLARPYLERITKERRLVLDRPIEIHKLQEAARAYYALANGVAGERVRPKGGATIVPFGPKPDEPLVPEFGLATVRYPYIQEDLEDADQTLRRYDDNNDGFINDDEIDDVRWTHRNPFADDLNKDGRLSRLELGQRYARRRLLRDDAGELVQKARRTGGEIRKSTDKGRGDESNDWGRQGGNKYWLTAGLMSRFDVNKNGRLESSEVHNLGIPVGQVDVDRDGELTRDELFALVSQMQDEAGDLTEGLPGWFYELDADRDGQVAMHEFTTTWTTDKRQEFASLDGNEDGLLTSSEVLRATSTGGYQNETAQVLPPYRTIVSEIEIEDDFRIRDVDVQISITHSHVVYLDGYLTGPDGTRIELFSEVGGGGNHFDQTVFDDQARIPITKAQAPFKDSFLPGGLLKREPGLSVFNGKSAKGVWQLIIRGSRNDRFGMLHSWNLRMKTIEDSGFVKAPAMTVPEVPTFSFGAESPPAQTSAESFPDEERREATQIEAAREKLKAYYETLKAKKLSGKLDREKVKGDKPERPKYLREKSSSAKYDLDCP
jgi:subtilisin-like proprotein convertase family protein/Ca2+-binding EF-hand superfamily protein